MLVVWVSWRVLRASFTASLKTVSTSLPPVALEMRLAAVRGSMERLVVFT